jgi:hypothetical protein
MKCEYFVITVLLLNNFILSNYNLQTQYDENISIELNKTDIELQVLQKNLKDFQIFFNSIKNRIPNAKKIKKLLNSFDESLEIQKKKREYFNKLKDSLLFHNNQLAKNVKQIDKINLKREESGIRRVNQIVQDMMDSKKVVNHLADLINKIQKVISDIFKTIASVSSSDNLNSNGSIFSTNFPATQTEKNSTIFTTNSSLNFSANLRFETSSENKLFANSTQYKRLRVWSSFRLEEDNSYEEQNSTVLNPTGRQIGRACISSFIGATRPNFCLKSYQSYLSQEISCPDGFRILGTSCIEECPEDHEYLGGICWKSCPEDLNECGPFCGDESCKKKNDFILRNYSLPKFLTLDHKDVSCPKYFKKSENICLADCEALGMVSCGYTGCASSPKMCGIFPKDVGQDFISSYTSLLGYIYSLKSSSKFDYSDSSNFPKHLRILKSYTKKHEIIMNETLRIYQKINSREESKENFLNYVAGYARKSFKKFNNKDELVRIEKICKRVSNSLLENIVNYRKKYDIDYLSKKIPTPYVVSCNSKSKIYDNENCVNNLTSFAKKLALIDLGGLAAFFIKPACNFDYF